MTKKDSTYQNSKVSLLQGADTLSFDSDGIMDFFGSEITGENLKALLLAGANTQIIANSAGVLSTLVVPSFTGLVIYSIADAASNASGTITSCLKGQDLIIVTRGVGSTGSIRISVLTGVSIIGYTSGALSVIGLNNSAASQAYIWLRAVEDNVWSVLDMRETTVTQYPDA